MRFLALFGMTLALHPASAVAQLSVADEFRGLGLDWGTWCPCQLDMTGDRLTFPRDPDPPGDGMARIVVDDSALGGNVCHKPAECRPPLDSAARTLFDRREAERVGEELPDLPEPLGPSLIRHGGMTLLEAVPGNRYCADPEIMRRAERGEEKSCIQRQELRFQNHRHDAADPHVYSVRFQMPARIENRTDSIRWVLAQWKHGPISPTYCREFDCETWGPSPFLAQRFDDGVLHITVQDEHCRCKVASAPDPDPNAPPLQWQNGAPQYCLSSRTGDPPNTPCRADLRVEYGRDPVLTAPLGAWVEMRYRVQADRRTPAVIEVFEGDRFIVRVTGKIGYDRPPRGDSLVTFKIGHYRDYMPFTHDMKIDSVTVRRAQR